MNQTTETSPAFLLATCQIGAEAALKAEMARIEPDFRFSFSRPGFLTFKAPGEAAERIQSGIQLVFARATALSSGKIVGDSVETLAAEFLARFSELPWNKFHVWPRDTRPPGKFGYEAGPTDASREAEAAIRRVLDGLEEGSGRLADLDRPTRDGELCLDCILVDQGDWWCGTHVAHDPPSRWSGGFFPDALPPHAVSRAYLKVAEALAWSGLPIKAGDHAAEIGCAPGGSSQYLLERGLYVLGVDPAAVDPRVAAHSRFTHLQKRGADVRRREFRKVKWLFADINVAPEYTFDTVEAIVTHPEVRVRGLVMMVKLLDWSLADELPALLARAKSWGYPRAIARQLHHNRQEICVVATR